MVNIKSLTLSFADEYAIVDFVLNDDSKAQVVFAPAIETGKAEDKYLVTAPEAQMHERLRYVADRTIHAAIAAALGEKASEEAAAGVPSGEH